MQIQDVYKLIHQAALGSEHSRHEPLEAKKWLERELQEMGTGLKEPIIDPISPNGEIVRVHLRPYISAGGDIGTLLNAFIRTGDDFRGDFKTLEAYWDYAVQTKLFSTSTMITYIQEMRTHNYPAVHHSSEYNQLYHPAYRVIRRKYLPCEDIEG